MQKHRSYKIGFGSGADSSRLLWGGGALCGDDHQEKGHNALAMPAVRAGAREAAAILARLIRTGF